MLVIEQPTRKCTVLPTIYHRTNSVSSDFSTNFGLPRFVR
jgi:hypothetical protein